MKWARAVVLGFLGVAVACASNSNPTVAEEEDAGYLKPDAGRRDSGKDATTEDDSGPVLIDAGKKDTGVKDVQTVDVTVTDANNPDTFVPPDASFVDVFVDGGPASTTLVINEIDYDQPVNDDMEFVEIYNRSSTDTVDLANLELAFFNGGIANTNVSAEYLRLPLGPGSLGPGQYLVVATGSVLDAGVSGATIVKTFTLAKNNIQNGERDSIIIVDKTTNAVLDAVTYEPALNGAPPSHATYTLVEGRATSASDSDTITASIARDPNGNDTSDNDADFKFTKTPTPGAANTITP